VAATALVREAKDPESAIRSRLQVHVIPGTYLIQVRLISPYAKGSSVIVNEVVAQYVSIAGGAVPIKTIDPARTPAAPSADARLKLMKLTPVGVLAVVLGLFLFAELCSGGVAGRHEKPLGAADDAGGPAAEP
jgi:hypothetical protein